MSEAATIRILVPVKSEDTASEKDQKDLPRLTATGKISHAKTRVYTQRYRKEWEEMADFKGWLTSVPYQVTRAFCLYCEKNLHAHRLSLLKHMCTLKHQKAANDYKKAELNKTLETADIQHMHFIGESEVEHVEEEDLFEAVDDRVFEEESQEEIIDDDEHSTIIEFRQIGPEIKKEQHDDPLAKAMAHVHGESEMEQGHEMTHIIEECVTETVISSDHDGYSYTVEDKNLDNRINSESDVDLKNKAENQTREDRDLSDIGITDQKNIVPHVIKKEQNSTTSKKQMQRPAGLPHKVPNIIHFPVNPAKYLPISNNQKMLLLTPDGKTVAISGGRGMGSQFVITGLPLNKRKPISMMNSKAKILKPSITQKLPSVTSNILDTSKGIACCGLHCTLYKLVDGKWNLITERTSGQNGEVSDFMINAKLTSVTGRYKIHYDVEKYYSLKKTECMYPYVEVVFDIKIPSGTYHIPILISPFSFSTHRDPNR